MVCCTRICNTNYISSVSQRVNLIMGLAVYKKVIPKKNVVERIKKFKFNRMVENCSFKSYNISSVINVFLSHFQNVSYIFKALYYKQMNSNTMTGFQCNKRPALLEQQCRGIRVPQIS